MSKDLGEKLMRKLEEALEGVLNEEDSKDEIMQGIRENVDLGEIVGEVISEDTEVREALKNKAKILLIEEIDAIDDIEVLYDDHDEMLNDIEKGAKISGIVKEVLESDEELREKLRMKVAELTGERIGDLDDDTLPVWDDFIELLNIGEQVKKIASQEDIRKTLEEKLKEVIQEDIGSVDVRDLPTDMWDLLGIQSQVAAILQNPAFLAEIHQTTQSKLQEAVLGLIGDEDDGLDLKNRVRDHQDVKRIIERQLDEVLRDPQFIVQIRETLKERILEILHTS